MKIDATTILCLLTISFGLHLEGAQGLRGLNNATVTVCVVDDTGVPVCGVHSMIYSLSDYDVTPGLTDTNGLFSCKLNNIFSEVGGSFRKKGYYQSSGTFWKWKKWGEIPPASTNFIITIMRIVDPVPMIKKDVTAYLPRLNDAIGFDMEIGDWVNPDGKGKYADMLITATRQVKSSEDFEFQVTISFTGKQTGIQPYGITNSSVLVTSSKLMAPNIAPDSGYNPVFTGNYSLHNNIRRESFYEKKRWIFRIRTKLDSKGDVEGANYGWLASDFKLSPNLERNGAINVTYYYNPDPHSRSLEPKEIADRQAKDIPEMMK